jgi:hypothetical protein
MDSPLNPSSQAMNVDLTPLVTEARRSWSLLTQLFSEHHFLTILCGFLAVMMIISCYKILRSISPALVGVFFLLVVSILFMHWTHTRTEPAFLTPVVNTVAPFFPSAVPERIATARM